MVSIGEEMILIKITNQRAGETFDKIQRNRPANHIFPSDFSAVNLHA